MRPRRRRVSQERCEHFGCASVAKVGTAEEYAVNSGATHTYLTQRLGTYATIA